MAIAALVVHVDPVFHAGLCAHLAADPTCLLGEPSILSAGVLLPLAVADADAASGEARFEELRHLPGVLAVDVVMIDHSDEIEVG
jgi:hypothetical protein